MTGREQNPFGLPNDWAPPPMPASMPAFVFLHSGNDTYHRLRGGILFEMMRKTGYKVGMPEDGSIAIPAAHRFIALVALDLAAVPWVETVTANPGSIVLVDVTGPVWAPEHILDLEPGGGARGYWSDSENQQRAQHLMRIADGLTTPHPAYAERLMDFNEQVFVIPDMDDGDEESCEAFMMGLQLAWYTAAEAKRARLDPLPA
jgi:hypothetical protein